MLAIVCNTCRTPAPTDMLVSDALEAFGWLVTRTPGPIDRTEIIVDLCPDCRGDQ